MTTGTARWREIIDRASQQTGVPGPCIEAVMRLESNGDPDALSPHGAVGLMQLMPGLWGHLGDLATPDGNILAGATLLAQLQQEHGAKGPNGWDRAICAYFTGQPEPAGSSDGISTDYQYIERVNQYWADIVRERAGQHALVGPPGSASIVSDVASLLDRPRPDAAPIVALPAGGVVALTGAGVGGYLRVRHEDQVGWIHSGYLTARVAEQVNLRGTPAQDADVIGTLEPGTPVRFKGRARIGFVGVAWDGGTGWVFEPDLQPATGGATPEAGQRITAPRDVDVRRTPSLRVPDNLVGAVAGGDALTLTGDSTVGYVTIVYGGGEAWAYAEYLCAGVEAPRPDIDSAVAGTRVTVGIDGAHLRSTPEEVPGNVVDAASEGDTLALTGEARDGYLAVTRDDQAGWVLAERLRARLTEPGVRLRSVPDASDPTNILVDGMAFGAEVTLTGGAENGYLGVDYRNQRGWAAAAYLGPLPERAAVGNWTALWGGAAYAITQEFRNMTGPDLYDYGRYYGLNGTEHPGVDVGMPYDTTLYAPMAGTIVCAGTGQGAGADGGGCAAFNDTGDGGPGSPPQGVGRIELLLDNGAALVIGHCRRCFHAPGTRVEAGEAIGTSGGMFGAHIHPEMRLRDASMPSGWRIVDPRDVLGW